MIGLFLSAGMLWLVIKLYTGDTGNSLLSLIVWSAVPVLVEVVVRIICLSFDIKGGPAIFLEILGLIAGAGLLYFLMWRNYGNEAAMKITVTFLFLSILVSFIF